MPGHLGVATQEGVVKPECFVVTFGADQGFQLGQRFAFGLFLVGRGEDREPADHQSEDSHTDRAGDDLNGALTLFRRFGDQFLHPLREFRGDFAAKFGGLLVGPLYFLNGLSRIQRGLEIRHRELSFALHDRLAIEVFQPLHGRGNQRFESIGHVKAVLRSRRLPFRSQRACHVDVAGVKGIADPRRDLAQFVFLLFAEMRLGRERTLLHQSRRRRDSPLAAGQLLVEFVKSSRVFGFQRGFQFGVDLLKTHFLPRFDVIGPNRVVGIDARDLAKCPQTNSQRGFGDREPSVSTQERIQREALDDRFVNLRDMIVIELRWQRDRHKLQNLIPLVPLRKLEFGG